MGRMLLVVIDWPRLREHFRREQGTNVADKEIEAWLRESGFTRSGDRWRVAEKDLGALDPTEVIEVAEEGDQAGDADTD